MVVSRCIDWSHKNTRHRLSGRWLRYVRKNYIGLPWGSGLRQGVLVNPPKLADQVIRVGVNVSDATMQRLYIEPCLGELVGTAKDATQTMNILFICSMNKWRSPTGEAIFRQHNRVNARSAGTSRKARQQVKLADIQWADLICVMEEKHLSRLRADFRGEVKHKTIHVLDIPDDYQFMDPELVDLISAAVEPMIDPADEG